MKNIRDLLSENFQFLKVKFSIYLNRRVFIMGEKFCDFLFALLYSEPSLQRQHLFERILPLK